MVGQEVMGITECRAEIGGLPHQPFGDDQSLGRGGGQKPACLFGKIYQDRVRFCQDGAVFIVDDRRDFRAGIDADIIGGKLLAFSMSMAWLR